MDLGITYNDYWEAPPATIISLCEKKIARMEYEANEKLTMAWYQGQLAAIGVNAPSKFPKQPHQVSSEVKSEEQSLDEQANALLLLKGKDINISKSKQESINSEGEL
jgi:hypothetical protein